MSGELRFATAPGRWVIAATVLGSGISVIDSTVVGIALPSIGRGFHTSLGPLQWVVTGYTLTLGAFLLLGGSLGDRYGRKRIFMIGTAWFALASVLCGIAPDAGLLIATRCLQGIGGALLTPGSLAILQASFTAEDRGRAIGAWSGLGGLAAAAGPVLGGYLVTAASWRWIFFINLPVAAFVLVVSSRHVPESRDPSSARGVDPAGAVLGVLALAGLTYLFIEGSADGWTKPLVLVSAVIGVLSAVSFLAVERSRRDPMLPLEIFGNRQFSATNGVTFVVYAALGGAFFLVPIELQVASRYSPLDSGLSLVPITVIMLVFSARSGRLASRIGPRLQMSAGPLVVAAGLALLERAASGSNYFEYVLPAVLVFGSGLAITVAPLTATAMESAPPEHAGIASAVNNDVARVAGLMAVAILPWLAGITGRSYLHPAELSSGFRAAVLISAAMCAAGGCLAALAIRNPQHLVAAATATAGTPGEPLRVAGADGEPLPECHYCAIDGPPLSRGS
ncbi:MAG TPA: MFS transporter [Acidimicrobiales bacterium]|nr:MFS transporter [Acidimicrobiales bacterium]